MTQHPFENRSEAISLGDEKGVKQVLLNSVPELSEVVNVTRIQPTPPERYRVTILGPARTTPGSSVCEETKRTAAALAEMGCDIITGGGRHHHSTVRVRNAEEAIGLIRKHHDSWLCERQS